MNALFADLILIGHLLFVLFVTGGLAAIWVGAALGWRWVRNPWFRLTHLLAILLVAAESLAGIACPLTVWEEVLRQGEASGHGFIRRWVHQLLYYDFPEWAFTSLYVAFALLVMATLARVRPEPFKFKTGRSPRAGETPPRIPMHREKN